MASQEDDIVGADKAIAVRERNRVALSRNAPSEQVHRYVGSGWQIMVNRRHNPAQVAQELRQIKDFFGRGIHRLNAIREVRITEQTDSRCRKQYDGPVDPNSTEKTGLDQLVFFHTVRFEMTGLVERGSTSKRVIEKTAEEHRAKSSILSARCARLPSCDTCPAWQESANHAPSSLQRILCNLVRLFPC